MSEESVEFVKRGYEALASADPLTVWADPAWADLVAPEAEFDLSAAYPDGPILRGVESWRGYADSSPWGRSLKFDPERYFDVDDERVLVFVRVTAEGRTAGFRSRRGPHTRSRSGTGSSCA